MKAFDTLLTEIPITKILNFFSFRLIDSNAKFNTYGKHGVALKFFVYNDIDSDSLQLFSSQIYKKISKVELFFSISQVTSLTGAIGLIQKIHDSTLLDSNANINTPISTSTLVNLILSFVEADGEILPITKTTQFKKRIFLSPNGYFKTPLFHYHIDHSTSNRIVNFVQWNDNETTYFNNNSYCLNASNYLDSNKYLFITSSPKVWISFPMQKHSPDYFQLLCHPQAGNNLFTLLYTIYTKYLFLKTYVHLGDQLYDNTFSCKAISFFLNQLNTVYFFSIDFTGTNYIILISFYDNREANITLAKIFSKVTYELQQNFMTGHQDSFNLEEELKQIISLESEKTLVGEKVTVKETINGNPWIAINFLNSFLKHLGVSEKLEIIHF